MTIHDSSFNTYTYIHVCILPIWDTRGVSYEFLVRIVQIRTRGVEGFFVRVEDEDDEDDEDEGGVASRLAPGGVGSVRSVRFLSVLGSVLGCLGDASFVLCAGVLRVLVPNHPCVGGLDGWKDGMMMEWVGMGHGWNGTH